MLGDWWVIIMKLLSSNISDSETMVDQEIDLNLINNIISFNKILH